MSKGLIWQDDENIIDVVYQSIYGLPVRDAMQVIKKYQEKQLIPIEWIKKQAFEYPQLNRNLFYQMIIEQWEKENEIQNKKTDNIVK